MSELEGSSSGPKDRSVTVNAKARWNKICYQLENHGIHLGPVVQTLDNAIHQIN